MLTQLAGFADLFVWLMLLKAFLLPLFVIPTGSMAETLAGAAALHTCPNCGWEYQVGIHESTAPGLIECPNCRNQERTTTIDPRGVQLDARYGDRIIVHGWTYDFGGMLAPKRWDVVVFRNPNDPAQNYIKRLIGLPGETIEIIDGDIWVTAAGESTPQIAVKTEQAQGSLWFPVYDHDYPPAKPVTNSVSFNAAADSRVHDWKAYHPRWRTIGSGGGWSDLETRVVRYEGAGAARGEIQFVTAPGDSAEPGLIQDNCGYNAYAAFSTPDAAGRPQMRLSRAPLLTVTDTRLSATVAFDGGEGYVELSTSKYFDDFFARLSPSGRVTLEMQNRNEGTRVPLGHADAALTGGETRFSLAHVDYHVEVRIDGRVVLRTQDEEYPVTAEIARQRSGLGHTPRLRIAAENVRARLSHLKIERDVAYVSVSGFDPRRIGRAVQGHPHKIPDDAYFVMGDNSAYSHDARWWGEEELGPHLQAARAAGTYQIGTVPASQMIGPAFLVYFPGPAPLPGLPSRMVNILPDFSRLRWIH